MGKTTTFILQMRYFFAAPVDYIFERSLAL